MSISKVSWDGSISFKYDGKSYTADVTAVADHYYSPGCMYRKNGDPGDPPEDEIENIEFDVQGVFDEYDNPVAYDTDMDEDICDAICDQAEWEADEPPEYDPPEDEDHWDDDYWDEEDSDD